ncbi:hypothetical protein [Corallococcus silvisoli]|uniref:hypothetical protein n=1 Tax=Corallococcus silvisoli TaxID=2697031 RepID=UPI0013783E60|nr:hypothetical protein [Corallococcus silvisoli]NBD09385.1 hypothetical protein [Corallococcus silvisoli]
MAGVTLTLSPTTVTSSASGATVELSASPVHVNPKLTHRVYRWSVEAGSVEPPVSKSSADRQELNGHATWTIPSSRRAGVLKAKVILEEFEGAGSTRPAFTWEAEQSLTLLPGEGDRNVREVVREALNELNSFGAAGRMPVLPVALQRTLHPLTTDVILWMVIRKTTDWLSFDQYSRFIDAHLCPPDHMTDPGTGLPGPGRPTPIRKPKLRLPFPGVDAYRKLKALTEAFMLERTGVLVDFTELLDKLDARVEGGRLGQTLPRDFDFEVVWKHYLEDVNGSADVALPYLAIIRNKLPDVPVIAPRNIPEDDYAACYGILQQKLGYPTFLELIWNYWHEEGMLVQAMNYISNRFQNVRGPGDRDPLANMEIDPLRPLNNVLWGYLQDEQHRLSVVRRAHEYDHEYGFTLHGKAVSGMRTADRRSKFLESFHNLLHQCVQFFRQDDDTTVVSDGFPVLNSLKETHYLLAQGAHNQFGDMPSTARQEMLMQQWLLSRPEMREFLGGRVMVPYPEPWMDRVDAMKSLLGWTDVSVVHFHDLAVYGEQVLLAVRYGAWSITNDPNQAANWARYWRPEIQGYIHAYRAVTGVDLAVDITDQQRLAERYVSPSVHLRNRLALQRRR